MRPFFVYMLRCADGSYYVGHTDDLEHRFAEHRYGVHDGYTAMRLPVRCVFVQECPTREEAQLNERRLKGWSRAKKEALVEGDWARIHELAKTGVRPSLR